MSETQATTQPFFRVTKGRPDADEFAALTAVMEALLQNGSVLRAEPSPARPVVAARWRRPERSRSFGPARSWRAA